MKKFNKIFLNLALVIVLALPMLAGCSLSGNTENNDNSSNITYTVNVSSNNTTYGQVYGSGTYTKDETIIIYAVANEGYQFEKWSDNNTENPRNLKMTQDKNLYASFIEKTKYYAIDKVEIYAEEYNTLSTKSVRLVSFKIVDNNNENIFNCNLNSSNISQYTTDGATLIEQRMNNSSPTIQATSSTPIVFYSCQNNYNKFTKNAAIELKFSFSGNCSDFVLNNDNTYTNSTFHPIMALGQEFNLELNNSTQTLCIYADNNHGYKIFARLSFVEI